VREIFDALKVVIIGVLAVGVLLGGLYALTTRMPERWRERGQRSLFVGPALVLLAVGLVMPALRTLYNAFFSDGQSHKFVGFGNFVDVFQSSDERTAILNTILWVVFGTVFSTVLGLTIAKFADRMRGEALAKALIFLPSAIALVGAGLIWKFVYAGSNQKYGLLNALIRLFHLPRSWGENGLWLLNWPLNTFLLIVILVWVQTGFATVVFSAAIKGVPDSMLEAARVDGATEREVFFKVVIPSIRATIVTVVTTTVIAALKVFDIVKASTGGNFKTTTIANNVYDHYFISQSPNLGSALAVILFILVVPVVIVNQRNQTRAKELA
jgi:alpha-glucoside transport system permease protein